MPITGKHRFHILAIRKKFFFSIDHRRKRISLTLQTGFISELSNLMSYSDRKSLKISPKFFLVTCDNEH